VLAEHKFKSEVLNLSCSKSSPYFAASFMDRSLKVWNLDSILNDGTKLEQPFASAQNAIELGPVDVQVAGSYVGASSMDGSIKLFNIN
jgi:WD40 repeat protein